MPRKKSSKEKGRVLEKLAASLYDQPGVTIKRNARLPVLHSSGEKKRTREIDILIRGTVAGVAIYIPVECKNEGRPIGVQEIGVFVDKLNEVGLAVRPSIFVSASGFTADALDRAREVGMLTRVLKEVTRKSASELVDSALQRRVYLLATIEELILRDGIADYVPIIETPQGAMSVYAFFDAQGEFVGTIPDLIWRRWRDGLIPSEIGSHPVELLVPEGWHRIVDGREAPIEDLRATVRVIGLLVTLRGTTRTHVLFDPVTKQIERQRLAAAFSGPQSTLSVMTFASEQALSDHLERSSSTDLLVNLGRSRLPRMLTRMGYWPPSEKALARVSEIMRSHPALPDQVTAADIEGELLNAVWDPIAPGYPIGE